MKKAAKILCMILCAAIILAVLYFAFAFLGNPVSYLLAKVGANRYMAQNFADSTFRVETIGYNFKTGGYYAHVITPDSQDSYFTVYFDGWGRYTYDTHDSIKYGTNTYSRLNEQYWDLVKNNLSPDNDQFDISIAYGELKLADMCEVFSYTDENGNIQHYTLYKEYGLERSELILDKEYDIHALGAAHGHIVLYIHDPVVSVEHSAELLQEVKRYLDEHDVPFYAVDFHLCEPRNEEGQNVGDQITLYEFLYSDIYEEGLIDRVQEHWDIAKEHHAIQDGLKKELELIPSTVDINIS